jgi:hypothetical protein
MAAFARMITAPLLLALHYLAVIPLHATRSLWIAAKVGLHAATVSQLSCSDGFNVVEFVKTIEHPVVAATDFTGRTTRERTRTAPSTVTLATTVASTGQTPKFASSPSGGSPGTNTA